jgi:hypothetical protein
MSNRKEMPKQTFSGQLKKSEKISCQWDYSLAIDVFLLTSAHEEEHVEALSSKVAHQKRKPTMLFEYRKYKIGVDRSDQMLTYYLFERKMIKWKKLIIHSLALAVVIAHTCTS